MSNTTTRRLNDSDLETLRSLWARADVPQKKSFLENLPALPTTVFGPFLGEDNTTFQEFSGSFPHSSPYKETTFGPALRTYVAWKVKKSNEKTVKKGGLLAVESSPAMEQVLLALRQRAAMLETIRLTEEVIAKRLANVAASKNSIALDVLSPLLSTCLGNIANSLRAIAMLHPEAVPAINEGLDDIRDLGNKLLVESDKEVLSYIGRYKVAEEEVQGLLVEIDSLSSELEALQVEELENQGFAAGEDDEPSA